MDIVPGLRDSVEKNGFNPAFPEDIGRIARLASEHWDKEYLPGYSSEQFSDVARSGTSSNSGKRAAANIKGYDKKSGYRLRNKD